MSEMDRPVREPCPDWHEVVLTEDLVGAVPTVEPIGLSSWESQVADRWFCLGVISPQTWDCMLSRE